MLRKCNTDKINNKNMLRYASSINHNLIITRNREKPLKSCVVPPPLFKKKHKSP